MSAPASLAPTGVRLPALDAMRAAGMLSVLALHAAIPYADAPLPRLLWAIHDAQTGAPFTMIAWWAQMWSMPVFFLLSGFFAVRLCAAHGPRGFLCNRVRRLAAPFLAGGLVILPAMLLVGGTGWVLSGRYTAAQLLHGHFQGEVRMELWGPAHLWYLEYLLVYCAGVWAITAALPSLARRAAAGERAGWWSPPLFAAATAAILWVDPAVVTEFHNSFVPRPLVLLYYAVFFAAGGALARRAPSPERFTRRAFAYVALSTAAFVASYLLARENTVVLVEGVVRLALALATAAFVWLALLGALGCCLRWFAQPQATIRYLAQRSYWIYLVHLPVVCAFQVALTLVDCAPALKFATVFAGTLAAALASYRRFAAGTVLERFVGDGCIEATRRRRESSGRGDPVDVMAPGWTS